MSHTSLGSLYAAFTAGELSRRSFLQRGAALGISTGLLTSLVANSAVAQDEAVAFPDAGTEGQERGAGGEIRVLAVQAASGLSVHNATGGKDISAGMVISEPLMQYDGVGDLVPVLLTQVPSIANGRLAEDLSSVTLTLLPDVVWSDGEPFTANDVKFTWEWNIDPANQSIDRVSWEIVSDIEVVDDLTAKVTFDPPTYGWFQAFSGNIGAIYPAHFWANAASHEEANAAFLMGPIGTGPFVLESFMPNEEVVYAANENYREANKPYFQTFRLRGGGDAVTSAQAVTVNGEWDLAFSLMIDPETLASIVGEVGSIEGALGTGVEKIQLNFSDPNTEVDGQKSEVNTPHPFLTDDAVRKAILMAINREQIAENLYGSPATPNMLVGLGAFESPNTSLNFDPDAATALLEEAGWELDGTVRAKDGVKLSVVLTSTVNLRRQKTQAVVKANLETIGVAVTLNQVDGSIFFDGDPANDQNFTHFQSDMQLYTDGATSAYPVNYMKYWYAGPNNENVAQAANQWTGTNKTRWVNAEYDAAFDQLVALTDPAEVAAQFITLNDMVVENVVEIPLVQTYADMYAISNRIRSENVVVNPFGDLYWNLANWNTAE
ncbi:MAG: peptide ABC transporter substrate-binding protein [Thermomicrobiales bacterium]|nr:peptide ABC transporter substrate-binding protein [Thermomicrobiales bacterium]MCO5218641.1 peptide ABC transporter substrate-binding protein [Thermomicrobiales bacterium]MCO5224318.1 peptide ABC transporter substrate-binding protein [Thermomicrobiales bacterium]MCO5229057.1 peptide ABC transporter substrate-binding protein [Thermomicrobiales bacterium]